MVNERVLLMALAVALAATGTTAAVLRPRLYRIGQDGLPPASSGVRYLGAYRSGRWVRSTPSQRNWSRFQGRGPGTAK